MAMNNMYVTIYKSSLLKTVVSRLILPEIIAKPIQWAVNQTSSYYAELDVINFKTVIKNYPKWV